jgi:hypothetical protein
MRFELRLIAIAALIFLLIAVACRRESIAEVRRGLDGPPADRPRPHATCRAVDKRDCGDNLKNR